MKTLDIIKTFAITLNDTEKERLRRFINTEITGSPETNQLADPAVDAALKEAQHTAMRAKVVKLKLTYAVGGQLVNIAFFLDK